MYTQADIGTYAIDNIDSTKKFFQSAFIELGVIAVLIHFNRCSSIDSIDSGAVRNEKCAGWKMQNMPVLLVRTILSKCGLQWRKLYQLMVEKAGWNDSIFLRLFLALITLSVFELNVYSPIIVSH